MVLSTDQRSGLIARAPRLDAPSASAPAGKIRSIRADEVSDASISLPEDRQRREQDLPVEKDTIPVGGESGAESHQSLVRRHPVAILIGAIFLTLAFPAGWLYWDYAQHFESTDDAFIASRQFGVAAKITGYIIAVPVTDNQHVAAGDVIARIDDRDYRIAVEQAQAQVATAQANIQNFDAQITVQQGQINANQAQVEQAEANLVLARQEATRYQSLAQKGAGTVESAQQYASQLHQQEAALKSAQAALSVAQRQIETLKAQRNGALASLAQAQAQRDQAELNLSYTTVTAAQAGRVVNLTAAVGLFAQPGANLAMFVPDEM